ncbi:YceI family protein [Gilvimarinus algae]|uniref:YceI family protein n=1 Tax=Gilvimarinus algae TaxID=3058037 RepID=A0ABT8TG82_9GAMM|nr:YceI family protein [Gilvimarinus sp. SDUM040014]MDO3382645.1 YceI family protein [Gilvimarinus sp. SDUM040014]
MQFLKITYCLSIVTVLLSLTACGALLSGEVERELIELKPGAYRLDPHHTTVLFKVGHLAVSDFVGRFNQASAELDYNASDPADSQLRASVNLASLDVNRPDFADTLKSCDWLCTGRYPQAVFESQGRARRDGNSLVFPGFLDFRGVRKAVELHVQINGATTNRLTGNYTLGFEAHLLFNRSDFGMGQFIPAVGDAVRIEVYAEFIRR